MFLLDTNIVSELVKRNPAQKVKTRIDNEVGGTLFISTVTVFELRFGAARSVKPGSLWGRIQQEILGRFQVLPLEEKDALAAADILSALASYGQHLALQDVWLAGVAMARNFTLVTRNQRHFDPITGLTVENWFE